MTHFRQGVLAAGALLLAVGPAGAQDKHAPACSTDMMYQQQDFTLGFWDVFGTDGRKSAEVRMEKRLDGCTIFETWTKPDGNKGNGLGLFTYSRQTKGWHYHWAADNGAMTVFTGSLVEPGEMRYMTERPTPGGGVRQRRWTLKLLPDGHVRELSVGSEDGGKSWTTEYDLLWVKKP
ncbi:MAG: hypothetical protein QM690_16975 [Sphingobium sp.]